MFYATLMDRWMDCTLERRRSESGGNTDLLARNHDLKEDPSTYSL